jgi:hypothetical protein
VTLAEGWDGNNWSIQSTHNPVGATNVQLKAVSCASPAFTAVGNSEDPAGNRRPALQFDEVALRDCAARAYDRSHDPDGAAR